MALSSSVLNMTSGFYVTSTAIPYDHTLAPNFSLTEVESEPFEVKDYHPYAQEEIAAREAVTPIMDRPTHRAISLDGIPKE